VLTRKQGKLNKQQRQAGQAHALGLAVKPSEGRVAEFENQLVFAELKFHDALLVEGGCLNTCNACASRKSAERIEKMVNKTMLYMRRFGAVKRRRDVN
jgi:hypothetical protein